MKLFESYEFLPRDLLDSVVAVGNFDGVHCGHQALLKKARNLANDLNKTFGILTFEPHPRELFRPDDPPARLTPLSLKAKRLEAAGADFVLALPFDWDFASQSAGDFIRTILQDGLKAAHIVVGEDFRFGQMRKGSPDDIRKAGINVTSLIAIEDGSRQVISSSRIREALRAGDIEKANDFLGWKWEIWGEIVKGDQRGRNLGYPTANFSLGRTLHPAYGVYAAFVQIENEREWRKAAVNVGIRPMFEIPEAQVESHIFDFTRDIYGRVLKVRPVKRIRSEARFNSLDELIAQMDADCAEIKRILD